MSGPGWGCICRLACRRPGPVKFLVIIVIIVIIVITVIMVIIVIVVIIVTIVIIVIVVIIAITVRLVRIVALRKFFGFGALVEGLCARASDSAPKWADTGILEVIAGVLLELLP